MLEIDTGETVQVVDLVVEPLLDIPEFVNSFRGWHNMMFRTIFFDRHCVFLQVNLIGVFGVVTNRR
jgi:hypothetical protein